MIRNRDYGVRTSALYTLGLFDKNTIDTHIEAAIKGRLSDSHTFVRKEAVTTPRKLNIVKHARVIARMLTDHEPGVLYVALVALGKLESSALEKHAHVIAGFLKDPTGSVRIAALRAPRQLKPAAIAHHAADIEGLRQSDPDDRVHREAVQTMGSLTGGGCGAR